MAYRKRTHMSAKMAAAMAAKVRLRMERPAPDRLPELPLLRRTVVVTDYDFGRRVHRLDFYKTNRIDCYRVEVDGKLQGQARAAHIRQNRQGHRPKRENAMNQLLILSALAIWNHWSKQYVEQQQRPN